MKTILFCLLILPFVSCKENLTSSKYYSPRERSNENAIYSERRQRLLAKEHNGVILIRSDYGYSGGRSEFRPANNFFYLTGFKLPGSIIMLKPGSPNPFTLFVTKKSVEESLYTGETPSIEEIKSNYFADDVLPLEESDQIIGVSLKNKIPVYIDFSDKAFKSFIMGMIKENTGDMGLLQDIGDIINEMRVIKDSLEIEKIKTAVNITGESFINACHECKPGINEFEIEGIIEYTFRKNGSEMPAFQSIVGSGPNSVKLHYSENSRVMQNGDILLMDIGAEIGNYCGDITRSIPVNGKFTREQREIYELVLSSQKAAIEEMKPGNYVISGHNASSEVLVKGLFDLGLITDTSSVWQKKFYLLYPNSHYLGMDVHDVGDYGASFPEMIENIASGKNYGRKLEAGMVLTIEPGLYFRSDGLEQLIEMFRNTVSSDELKNFIEKVGPVYSKYINCGIRIEDDVLITDNGYEILSSIIPKELNQIENLMK